MKAVAYLRVSGASQVSGEGWDRQLDAINAYASAHDCEIVNVYREEAIPGKTEMDQRPAFMSMLADLLSNGCRTIIVERLDRLAREFRIQEELLLYLMRHELTLISSDTGENITAAMSADPMRKFVVQLQGLLAELDKNLLVAKLRKARANVRARGQFAGGNIPYGQTRKHPSAIELGRAEAERDTAERIRELRAEGSSLKRIGETLSSEGRSPRGGGKWHQSTIRAILELRSRQCAKETQ